MLSGDNKDFLTETLKNEKDKLKLILKNEIVNYEDAFFCLSNVIDQKQLLEYQNSDSIYLDFKKLIKLYIKSCESKEMEYDEIDVSMIDNKLDKLDIQEKCLILEMFRRELRKNSFNDKSNECDYYIDKARLFYYKSNLNFKNSIKYLALLSSSSFYNLLITILFLIGFVSILFLPSPFSFMSTINVNLVDFSQNGILNYISNIFSLLFDLDFKMEIKAINFGGVILLGLLKLLFVTIIANYLWKKVVHYIKIIS